MHKGTIGRGDSGPGNPHATSPLRATRSGSCGNAPRRRLRGGNRAKINSGPLLPLRGIFPRKRGKQTVSTTSCGRRFPFSRWQEKVPRSGG